MVKIAPSILAADFDNLENEVSDVEKAGADYIHIDIMDGEFVNNETPGLEMLTRTHETTSLTLDTHLMVEEPQNWLDDVVLSNVVTFHIEAVNVETAEKIIDYLHERDIKAGVAIKPDTSIEDIMPIFEKIDVVLVMLVEPGFGGQKMILSCLEKVKTLRSLKPDMDIEVDGGVNLENVQLVKDAGANIIVSGTAIFKSNDRKFVIEEMKK
jgi:ribulose-phosphate 3-epimerase